MSATLPPIPKLGFGTMRLPEVDEKIVIDQVCEMVDYSIAKGFNYFDTAFMYHGGKSEGAVKEALVQRHPRESFYLADKLPAWEMKTLEDRDRLFDIQRERTGVEYFDFYLLHSINKEHLETYDKLDCWNWALEKKKQGLIKHFGFSFHDNAELLDEILTNHPEVEFVQLQINYADWDNPEIQSGGCYQVAFKHGVPVFVMEPVKGGALADFGEEINALLLEERPEDSIASWAIRFAASLEGVAIVLSGMSNLAQLQDNIKTMTDFDHITKPEEDLIEEVAQLFKKKDLIPCTTCGYCLDGCPVQIKIPELIQAKNDFSLNQQKEQAQGLYEKSTASGGSASGCIACGACEEVCPQHIPIITVMKDIAETFGK